MASPARRPPLPKPRFTLGLLYLFGFFFVYCFALAGPALWAVTQPLPPDPAQEAAAKAAATAAARQALEGRLWLAFGAALLTTAFGMARGWLPGTR